MSLGQAHRDECDWSRAARCLGSAYGRSFPQTRGLPQPPQRRKRLHPRSVRSRRLGACTVPVRLQLHSPSASIFSTASYTSTDSASSARLIYVMQFSSRPRSTWRNCAGLRAAFTRSIMAKARNARISRVRANSCRSPKERIRDLNPAEQPLRLVHGHVRLVPDQCLQRIHERCSTLQPES